MELPAYLHGIAHDNLIAEGDLTRQKSLWAVVLGLVPFKDGNRWCVLYGDNIQEGIVGFGETPMKAVYAFDDAWHKP